MVVAVSVGRSGINSLLVASQVVLSVVLPFVAFPLIYLTSSEVVMRVRVTPPDVIHPGTPPALQRVLSRDTSSLEIQEIPADAGSDTITSEVLPKFDDGMPETIDYSNGLFVTILSYLAWGVIFIANSYAIVMLCLGINK
jgi:metal iron transporter